MAIEADAGRIRDTRGIAGKRTLVVLGLLAALAVAVFAAAQLFGGDDSNKGELKGSSENNFTLSYPSAWRPLSSKELAKLPGHPSPSSAVRTARDSWCSARRNATEEPVRVLGRSHRRLLDKRVPDFQKRLVEDDQDQRRQRILLLLHPQVEGHSAHRRAGTRTASRATF